MYWRPMTSSQPSSKVLLNSQDHQTEWSALKSMGNRCSKDWRAHQVATLPPGHSPSCPSWKENIDESGDRRCPRWQQKTMQGEPTNSSSTELRLACWKFFILSFGEDFIILRRFSPNDKTQFYKTVAFTLKLLLITCYSPIIGRFFKNSLIKSNHPIR